MLTDHIESDESDGIYEPTESKEMSELSLFISLTAFSRVKKIIDEYPGVIHQFDADGNGPLHIVAETYKSDHYTRSKQTLQIAALLLQSGVDINRKNAVNQTALHLAASSADAEFALWLIEKGADIHAVDSLGISALSYAMRAVNDSLLDRLLELGAKPLMHTVYLAVEKHSIKWLTHFLQTGFDFTEIPPSFYFLQCAVLDNHLDTLQLLLAHGLDVNSVNKQNRSVLHVAAHINRVEMLQYLLQHGADVHLPDIRNQTALHVAAGTTNTQCLTVLLEFGAQIEAVNREGWTALHQAAIYDRLENAELLIAAGANYRSMNAKGQTPFSLAVHMASSRVVKLLAGLLTIQELTDFIAKESFFPEVRYANCLGEIRQALDHKNVITENWNRFLATSSDATQLKVLRASNLAFFRACKNPVEQTGIPMDLQLNLAKCQLEVDVAAGERFLAALEHYRLT